MKTFLIMLFLLFCFPYDGYAQEAPVNKECVEGDCTNGQGTMVFSDESKYTGEWKEGKLHGRGSMVFADGSKYEGDFKDGEMTGHGIYVRRDGIEIAGEWKNGKRFSEQDSEKKQP